jgi:hypothetical protein
MARSLVSLAMMAIFAAPLAAQAGDGSGYYYPGDPGACPGGCDNGSPHHGGFNQFWHRCGVDFHRNNSWPEPFLTADKIAVRTPYCIQTDNGWKMQNTIGSYLFDAETQRVNQAGELLVKWVVTQAPAHRRAVFVLKADSAEATKARVESVQLAVAKFGGGCMYPVLLTDSEPSGWPASYIDSISQQYSATMPAPRLPPRQGNGQSGGGSGSGGGGGGGVQ